MSTSHTPVRIVLLAAIVIGIGTICFSVFESITPAEAFYQTLLAFLTHYTPYDFISPASKVIKIIIILASFGLLGYLLKWSAEYMIGVDDTVRKRRLHNKIKKFENHYIVCGLGRVGSQIVREMAIEEVPFVALDRDKSKVDEAVAAGYLAFQADSAEEDALKMAGIDKAAGLVASLGDDSANLLATLTARSLNPELFIVARANRQQNEVKLKRAGANRVALPYQIGGYHMASMVLRPNVVDYMDVVSSSGKGSDLQVEEMVVGEHSRLAGHRLGKSLAEGAIGATVIAINGSDGASRVRPTGKEMIYSGDRLIVLGSKNDLTKASELIR